MFDSDRHADAPGGGGPPDPLCDRLVAAVDALAADDPAVLDMAGQLARLRTVSRLVDRLEALRVRLVGVADRSGALADDGAATAAAWLRRHSALTAAQAGAHARVARRLSDLPVIADALHAGDIGIAHATQIDRLCGDVGVDQVAGVQSELVAAAVRLRDVAEFTRMCAGWRHALRPDLADDADDRAYANRRLTYAATFDGVLHLSGVFDAEAGATLATAINAFLTHDPPDTPPQLQRTMDQRRADALLAVGQAALASPDAPDVAGARPHLVVRVNLADLINHPDHPDHHRLPGGGHRGPSASPPTVDWGGPIGRETLVRLFDDCAITRIVVDGDGRPLDVGTTTRVWPAAIRKAINERDRGCRFDGCDRPPAWCDIDHIIPVEAHGPTSVTNGLLLCRHHHRAKRRDGWWPTLHDDATVTWTHTDGRTRTDPPPHTVDHHVAALLNPAHAPDDPTDAAQATDTTCGHGGSDPSARHHNADHAAGCTGSDPSAGHHNADDTRSGYAYPDPARHSNDGTATAGETRGTYHTGRAPPRTPHSRHRRVVRCRSRPRQGRNAVMHERRRSSPCPHPPSPRRRSAKAPTWCCCTRY